VNNAFSAEQCAEKKPKAFNNSNPPIRPRWPLFGRQANPLSFRSGARKLLFPEVRQSADASTLPFLEWQDF